MYGDASLNDCCVYSDAFLRGVYGDVFLRGVYGDVFIRDVSLSHTCMVMCCLLAMYSYASLSEARIMMIVSMIYL